SAPVRRAPIPTAAAVRSSMRSCTLSPRFQRRPFGRAWMLRYAGRTRPLGRTTTNGRTYRRRVSMYHVSRALGRASALIIAVGLALAPPVAAPSHAASSKGCEGGGFVISGLNDKSTIGMDGTFTIPADSFGPSFLVDGTYVEFTVVSASFGVEDWTL